RADAEPVRDYNDDGSAFRLVHHEVRITYVLARVPYPAAELAYPEPVFVVFRAAPLRPVRVIVVAWIVHDGRKAVDTYGLKLARKKSPAPESHAPLFEIFQPRYHCPRARG